MRRPPGSFPLTIVNEATQFAPDQVFVTVIGVAPDGRWCYLEATGQLHPIDHTAASAPDHLSKGGVDYPNMSFTLAQASTGSGRGTGTSRSN